MKVLLLLRHADSSEKVDGQTDHERVITSRGVQQVSQVAAFMKRKSLIPEKVIASSAVRARTTVELLLKETDNNCEAFFADELYEGEANAYLNVVHEAGAIQSLLIVGHNPAISTFASHISKTRVGRIGTANLLVFHFKGDTWDKLGKGECELMEHLSPE